MELKGMYDDSLDRANSSEGTWTTNTRNIVITKDKKAVKNEDGFNFYATNYTAGATPIGFITLYDDEVIIFSATTTSEIGKIDKDGKYKPILRADGLGFSIEYPISGRHQYNIYGDIEIVFTDNHTPVKTLNIDRLPFEVNPDKTIKDPTQLNSALMFPEVIIPDIVVDAVGGSGGNITTGTIFFTGQYVDDSGFVTNCFPLSNPTRIFPITSTYDQISGIGSGEKTGNIVKLVISNIDTRYKELRLIVVRKQANQFYAEQFTSITISNAVYTTVYTGLEDTISRSLSNVLVDRPSYTTASSVLISDDILYLADVGTKPVLNIQKYVNNWRVRFTTDKVSCAVRDNSYKEAEIGFKKSTFMHNEVYGLYAVVTMLEGDYQYAFHIPGREVRTIEKYLSAGILENQTVNYLYGVAPFLTEDGAIDGTPSPYVNTSVRYYQTRDTSSIDGTMGYWENQHETYPNKDGDDSFDIWDANGDTGRTLKGQKVRHHKMPSHGSHGYVNTNKECNILGIKIDQIYLPADIRAKIQNIEIYYAKRTGANSTLAGRSLFMFTGKHIISVNDSEFTSNAGNWHTQSNSGTNTVEFSKVRMYSFDMLVDKTNVRPTFIYNNWKITTPSRITGTPPPGNADGSIFIKLDMCDYGGTGITNILPVADEWRVRGIYNQRYLPFNTNIGLIEGAKINNRWCEETFFAFLRDNTVNGRPANNSMNLNIPTIQFNSGTLALNGPDAAKPGTFNQVYHETYTTDLLVWKEDVYDRFHDQEFVSTGYRIDNDAIATVPIFGGDGYVGTQGIVYTAPTMNTYGDTDEHDGIRTLVKFFVETANPAELQYGDFYPKVDWGTLGAAGLVNNGTRNDTEYPIRCNKDYTAVNSLNVVSHMNFEALDLTRYTNRILRSTKAQRGELNPSWREFLPENYYDTARDRGAIIHLEAINGEILIQHEYGLYITRGSEQLQTDVTTVEVGTGDVFARPPKEIMDSKDGYVGCNSKFVCGKFKGGYFTADEKQGKIFIMDNSLKEVSNTGMYKWFRDNLPMTGTLTTNNTFVHNGLCASYDEVNNRIIFVKKQLNLTYNDFLHYKGHYTEDIAFIRSLKTGDIVYKDGKYMRVTTPSPYEGLPPDEVLPSK